jgi:pimeloyl-ACP methyl ester carboxylesterase
VLSKTQVENVTYIGHSQGTIQMFAALCENLEFFKPKINLAIMLAPVARVDRLSSPTIQKMKENETLRSFIENTMGPEVLPSP